MKTSRPFYTFSRHSNHLVISISVINLGEPNSYRLVRVMLESVDNPLASHDVVTNVIYLALRLLRTFLFFTGSSQCFQIFYTSIDAGIILSAKCEMRNARLIIKRRTSYCLDLGKCYLAHASGTGRHILVTKILLRDKPLRSLLTSTPQNGRLSEQTARVA